MELISSGYVASGIDNQNVTDSWASWRGINRITCWLYYCGRLGQRCWIHFQSGAVWQLTSVQAVWLTINQDGAVGHHGINQRLCRPRDITQCNSIVKSGGLASESLKWDERLLLLLFSTGRCCWPVDELTNVGGFVIWALGWLVDTRIWTLLMKRVAFVIGCNWQKLSMWRSSATAATAAAAAAAAISKESASHNCQQTTKLLYCCSLNKSRWATLAFTTALSKNPQTLEALENHRNASSQSDWSKVLLSPDVSKSNPRWYG